MAEYGLVSIAILGTVGVPASYGGFETLADNLVVYARKERLEVSLSVCCSGRLGRKSYSGAQLRYLPISANGVKSVLYDVASLLSAVRHKDDVILLLGVSGAIALPLVRLVSDAKIVTNVDGVEWKRSKWGWFARLFLRFSEYLAVRFSHEVIADNRGIAEHIEKEYSASCNVIAYGGDHAITAKSKVINIELPDRYALALCRIEPENNIEMILDGFPGESDLDLVFIGNWDSSKFGRDVRRRYGSRANFHLIDPIYDSGVLKSIRSAAEVYIHGHSAGGTNPSLVEMMHFELPIFAFDCIYNRHTTDDRALFFASASQLTSLVDGLAGSSSLANIGSELKQYAAENYTWALIGRKYFNLLVM